MSRHPSLGQVAYDRYYAGRTPELGWDTLSQNTRNLWESVATAVAAACVPQRPLPPGSPGPYPTSDEDAQRRQAIRDFWLPLIAPNGTLDPEPVLNELSDYSHVLNEVPKVYAEVTGGALSKVNYFASAVIGVYENHMNESIDEAVLEVLLDLAEDEEDPQHLAQLSEMAKEYGCPDLKAASVERVERRKAFSKLLSELQQPLPSPPGE